MTTFPPEDPGRDDETPAEERAEDEQSSVDESIPETPGEDALAADEQLANESPDDAETTPLEDARAVEAEDEAAEEETEERADLASASESDIVADPDRRAAVQVGAAISRLAIRVTHYRQLQIVGARLRTTRRRYRGVAVIEDDDQVTIR